MLKAAMLLGQGHDIGEVAERVGKPEDTVEAWRRKPEFAALCQDECDKWLLHLKPQALMLLKTLMEADDKKLGYNAANFLLRYAAQLESAGEAQILVNFTGGMPEPGMPEQAANSDGEEGEEE